MHVSNRIINLSDTLLALFDATADMPTNLTKASRFLELPPELCNAIYNQVARDTTHIKLEGEGSVLQPVLASVCKQVRTELLPIWEANDYATISGIDAEIISFDFDFLLRTLKAQPEDARPVLNIKFKFVGPVCNYMNGLIPWLSYCAEISPECERASYTINSD